MEPSPFGPPCVRLPLVGWFHTRSPSVHISIVRTPGSRKCCHHLHDIESLGLVASDVDSATTPAGASGRTFCGCGLPRTQLSLVAHPAHKSCPKGGLAADEPFNLVSCACHTCCHRRGRSVAAVFVQWTIDGPSRGKPILFPPAVRSVSTVRDPPAIRQRSRGTLVLHDHQLRLVTPSRVRGLGPAPVLVRLDTVVAVQSAARVLRPDGGALRAMLEPKWLRNSVSSGD